MGTTMGASEGGLGKCARNEVSPEMKIPESVVALEKSEKGGNIRVEVDEKNPLVEGENWRCKDTDSCQEAPTVNNALVSCYGILENNYLVENVRKTNTYPCSSVSARLLLLLRAPPPG